jgi:hypothetical protein
LSVSKQKKLHGVRSVNVTTLRPREAPLRARGSKGWCSYGGSEVRPTYSGISTSLAFRQHLTSFHIHFIAPLYRLNDLSPPLFKLSVYRNLSSWSVSRFSSTVTIYFGVLLACLVVPSLSLRTWWAIGGIIAVSWWFLFPDECRATPTHAH